MPNQRKNLILEQFKPVCLVILTKYHSRDGAEDGKSKIRGCRAAEKEWEVVGETAQQATGPTVSIVHGTDIAPLRGCVPSS